MVEAAAHMAFYLVFGVSFLIALGAWIVAAKDMIKAARELKPNRRWGLAIPMLFLLPSFFTEAGNIARERHLKAVGVFVLAIAAGFALGLLKEWFLARG